MKGIHRFVGGHHHFRAWAKQDGDTLRQLAKGQSPEALVVSCSDSRVIPELITNAGPGALFVVRNVANLVPPYRSGNQSVGAALAYAIDHLRVGHLVVLGHYGCGGMAAVRELATGHAHLDPVLPAWLEYGRDSWDELVAAGDAESADWHDRLVEENVLQQLANALEYPVVARAIDEGRLALHAWIYDLAATRLCFWDPERERFSPDGAGAISADQVADHDNARGPR